MSETRFTIDGELYTTTSLDSISLKDLMVFNTQMADLGLPYTWGDIESASQEMVGLSDSEASLHPMAPLLTGLTIWASRRAKGEQLTIAEAVDVRLSSLVFLPPAEDRATANPTKGRTAAKASKASAPAGADPKADAAPGA
jgi:hypothetical protein